MGWVSAPAGVVAGLARRRFGVSAGRVPGPAHPAGRASALPAETVRALRQLGATEATIIGGTAAVSTEIADSIAAEGVAVHRLAGATRYETSRKVADLSVAAGMDPSDTWSASGRTWPDALSAGPAAAAERGVLLLIDGTDLDGSPPARSWLGHVSLS